MKKNEVKDVWEVRCLSLRSGEICAKMEVSEPDKAWNLFRDYLLAYGMHPWMDYYITITKNGVLKRSAQFFE